MKMTWSQICETYPNEWVVVVNYENNGPVDVDGTIVAHGPDRESFKGQAAKAMKQYGRVAVRFTGELVQESDLPLLWQIFHTA